MNINTFEFKRTCGGILKEYFDGDSWWLEYTEGEIKKALPSVLTPERFTRMVLSALSTNPKLGECTPRSFLAAMMAAAQLGLEPNTPLGQAYLIPYGNNCQFQLGYKGLIDLAYRSGEVEVIQAHVVYENDEFTCEYGLEPKLTHKPYLDGDPGKLEKVMSQVSEKALKRKANKNVILALSSTLVWFVALLIFVVVSSLDIPRSWIAFLYAIPADAIVQLSLRSAWKDFLILLKTIPAILTGKGAW